MTESPLPQASTGTAVKSPAEVPGEGTEPLRVLVPSPLGLLGIEFQGSTVSRLIIQPPRSDRKHFSSLKQVDRSDQLDEALGRLSEYFAGARQRLEIEFDLSGASLPPLAQRVLLETLRIPYGSTRNYQKMAAAVGAPEAYRQIRSILMSNPIPILIPCHRVVPRKGGAGSYIAGERKKQWLLRLESRGVKGL